MRRQKGFTLIELLIVVAIIGIIAAIAIPNLLAAINRGRQKRTMADIRTIGTAVEAYATDFNFYPKVAAGLSTASLQNYITPTFIKRLPDNDGWNNAIQWVGDSGAGTSYTLYSGGKDGTVDSAWVNHAVTDFNNDIVFSNGQFYQWPEGMQVN